MKKIEWTLVILWFLVAVVYGAEFYKYGQIEKLITSILLLGITVFSVLNLFAKRDKILISEHDLWESYEEAISNQDADSNFYELLRKQLFGA